MPRSRSNPLPKPPTTLPAFQARFPDDEACHAYLFDVRWPDGFVCPKCSTRTGWWRTHRPVIECANGHQTSVTAGTVIHRTKMPLRLWFYGAFLVSTLTPGISALQFQKQLGIGRYETAYQMLHKLRASLVDPAREKLKGEVEVDEAFVGGAEEGRPGRGAETKTLVIIAVEMVRYEGKDKDGNPVEKTRAGRARMSVIPNAEGTTLRSWVQHNVAQGSTVYTDGWSGYKGLGALGYTHHALLQSHEGKKTGRYLPMVHLIVSNLKRWLLGTYKGAVLPKHLPAYLNEFVFRFNRRFWHGPAFNRALGLMVAAKRHPEYATLYAAGTKEGWEHPA